jgi:hypothetical protein
MRLWFRRSKGTDDRARMTREALKKQRRKQSRQGSRSDASVDDPIKNWETPDQAFLRQAGDPFIDG